MNDNLIDRKIHFIGSNLEDNPKLKKLFSEILKLKSLEAPIVCLPDLYLKARTEAPASIATATKGTIVPTLSAPSLGCSMGMIATSLNKENITPEVERAFFAHIQDELGKYYNFFENISVWLGFKKRPLKKYDLTLGEFEDFIKFGAMAAVKRYGLPSSTVDNMEFRGSVFSDEEIKNLNLKNILPRSSFTNGRHDLGYGFKGNHFLEIHIVEDVLDETAAKSWGLKPNQVLIFYHGGGGIVPYHVGRYYANRRKNNFKQKFFLRIGKVFFHLMTPDGLKNFKTRLRYYFFPDTFQEIDANSTEGRRYLLATKAAINYSYAFNIAIMRRVMDSFEKTFPGRKIDFKLVSALVHNSINKENIKGQEVFLHRHTLNRVEPGKAIPLAGMGNTINYLGLGLESPPETLASAEHGTGENIKRFKKSGESKEDPNHQTTIYRTKVPFETKITHLTSEGVDFVMNELEKASLIKPIIKMRPIASFKG